MKTSDPITNLINALSRLPGIGERTASRLAFYILNQSDDLAQDLAHALVQIKERVSFCKRCCNLTENDLCTICSNPKRDRSKVCVVENVPTLRAVENTGEFRGMYHVLHGLISPLEGISPDDIRIAELLRRMTPSNEFGESFIEDFQEVIIATSPSVDGEATSLYLSRVLKPIGIKASRIASGVPIGSDIEYIDRMTLSRAIQERRDL